MQSKFRTEAKLHFLTYPQCDVPLQEILAQLKRIAGDRFGWAVISAEDHEERENDSNVGVHRHVMQEYTCKKFETRNPRFWDITYEGKTYHPHFEKVKKKVDCLQYVIKDGNYITDGNYKEVPFSVDVYIKSTKTKGGYGFTYMANEIKSGKTLDDLDEICPGHVLHHKRKLEEYTQFQQEKKIRQTVKPKFPGFKLTNMPYDWVRVAEWANLNFLEKRKPRQPQLWLWSRQPEMGKTYPWAITLREYYNCYEWIYGPKQSKEMLTCDYILIDELKGGITVTELKSLSQMYGMNLDIKYERPQFFNKNVPLIITSNRPPREIYHKCNNEDMESLESRFIIIEIDEPCHLVVDEELEDTIPVTQILARSPPNPLLLGTPPESQDQATLPIEEEDDGSELVDLNSDSEDSEYTKMEKLRRKK